MDTIYEMPCGTVEGHGPAPVDALSDAFRDDPFMVAWAREAMEHREDCAVCGDRHITSDIAYVSDDYLLWAQVSFLSCVGCSCEILHERERRQIARTGDGGIRHI